MSSETENSQPQNIPPNGESSTTPTQKKEKTSSAEITESMDSINPGMAPTVVTSVPNESNVVMIEPDKSKKTSPQWDPQIAFHLGLTVLIFGIIVLLTMAMLLIKGHRADSIVKIFALPLVIISAIFLVVVGYSQEQITPVMALLSAIAGYLLGNQSSDEDSLRKMINTEQDKNNESESEKLLIKDKK